MPHDLKLEGSPGCPSVVPVTVPEGRFALVKNQSNLPLGWIEHLNSASTETIGSGEQQTFVSSVFLVATGSTDIQLSFGDVGDAVSPDTLPEEAPVEETSGEAPVEAPAETVEAPTTEEVPAEAPTETPEAPAPEPETAPEAAPVEATPETPAATETPAPEPVVADAPAEAPAAPEQPEEQPSPDTPEASA